MGEISDILYIEMYSHGQEAHEVGFRSPWSNSAYPHAVDYHMKLIRAGTNNLIFFTRKSPDRILTCTYALMKDSHVVNQNKDVLIEHFVN